MDSHLPRRPSHYYHHHRNHGNISERDHAFDGSRSADHLFSKKSQRFASQSKVGRGHVGDSSSLLRKRKTKEYDVEAKIDCYVGDDSSSNSSSDVELSPVLIHRHHRDDSDYSEEESEEEQQQQKLSSSSSSSSFFGLSHINASKHGVEHAGSIVGVGEGANNNNDTGAFSKAAPFRSADRITTEETPSAPTRLNDNKQQIRDKDTALVPSTTAPYWLYLMSIVDSEHTEQKTLTHVGKSRSPVDKVRMHNERLVKSKSTRPAAGKWSIEMAIGPFRTKSNTYPIRDFWKRKRRGPASRRHFGKWIAGALGLECYDARMGEERDYLEAWNTSRKKRRKKRKTSTIG